VVQTASQRRRANMDTVRSHQEKFRDVVGAWTSPAWFCGLLREHSARRAITTAVQAAKVVAQATSAKGPVWSKLDLTYSRQSIDHHCGVELT
jgi:alpha-D-ribose 1-methylphosphonate 5-triphosphate synthase subunit PhnH